MLQCCAKSRPKSTSFQPKNFFLLFCTNHGNIFVTKKSFAKKWKKRQTADQLTSISEITVILLIPNSNLNNSLKLLPKYFELLNKLTCDATV